jgi:hypothetical protein
MTEIPYTHISLSPIITLEDWETADEPLTGSRAKNTVFDPETEKSFVFKEPKELREAQIWSELLASYIAGDLLGWPVQHVSLGTRADKTGNLMEYIFNNQTETFTEGWQLCREIDGDYDFEKGERHTLDLLMQVGNSLEKRGLTPGAFYSFWARAFALDTLISNTDRHAENWAIIEDQNGDMRMAPLYDNATSMGCEWDETGLARRWFDNKGNIKSDRVTAHIARGCHHVRAEGPARRGGSFADICQLYLETRPEQKPVFQQVADLDLQPVFTLMGQIMGLDTVYAPYAMTANRGEQIQSILIGGQERIKNILVQGVK